MLAPLLVLLLAGSSPSAGWVEALTARTVEPPQGGAVALYGEDGIALLDAGRLAACLAALDEAGAWPEAWLVVVDLARPYDVVVAVRSVDGAEVVEAFAAERVEWDVDGVRRAARAALGRKPRTRVDTVVVQEFSRRVVDRYPYAVPADGARQGLLAAVPPGAVLRDAATVDLGAGGPYTLAIVMRDARFVPARCAPGEDRHVDVATFELVLTDASTALAALDLTAWYRETRGQALALPRFACAAGDAAGSADPELVRGWIRDRPADPLLDAEDLDGDGRALESRVPTAGGETIVVGVDPASRQPFAR